MCLAIRSRQGRRFSAELIQPVRGWLVTIRQVPPGCARWRAVSARVSSRPVAFRHQGWASPSIWEVVNMGKRAKEPGRRKQLDPAHRAQVIIAVLGAVSAVAGCVAQLTR